MLTSDNAWGGSRGDAPQGDRQDHPPEYPTTVPVDSSGQEPELDLGIVASGNADVDDTLTALSGLDQVPINDHPAIYENVHEKLSHAMSQFDDLEVDPETGVDS